MSSSLDSLSLRVQAEQIADSYLPKPGRPARVSEPDTVQLFLAALADGNYRETACKMAGLSKATLYNTLKRAEAGEDQAIAFVDAMEKAEASAEAETVRNVRQASKLPQFWAAGMTWLERKSPDRWGKRQDDASVPKVIVQIGARESDVTVNVLSPSTPQQLDTISTGQVRHEGLIIRDYVNHDDVSSGARSGEGPSGEGGALPARVGAGQIKGGRGGRKKKARG